MRAPGTNATPDADAATTGGGPIVIEFDLPPDQAGRVFRHRAVSAHRRGRTRTSETTITWHDLPPGTDADDGTLLVHDEAGWALQRTTRRDGWPAGTHALAVAGPDATETPVPRAVAALSGRTRRVELAPEGADAPLVAVSLLEGALRGVSVERACCRVRVHGEPVQAARLALLLGETLPLLPCAQSLGELAWAVAHAAAPAAVLPEPPAAALVLPEPPAAAAVADGDVDAALASVFGALSAALLFWVTRLRTPDAAGSGPPGAIEARAVHQARVATRRLRSALTLFREPLGGSLDALRGPLAALARTLGRLRDWDVFVQDTGGAVAAALGADALGADMTGRAQVAALLGEAERLREAARAEVRRVLARPATRRLLLHLSLLSALRPWREGTAGVASDDGGGADASMLARPIRALAPRLLDRRFRKLVSAGKHIDRLDGAALHGLRKTAKTLRYALEFLGPALPRRDSRRLLRRLAALQDQLGAVNDAEAGRTMMRALARPGGGSHDWAAGVVTGWLAARAACAHGSLGETWHAVRHTGRFWRA